MEKKQADLPATPETGESPPQNPNGNLAIDTSAEVHDLLPVVQPLPDTTQTSCDATAPAVSSAAPINAADKFLEALPDLLKIFLGQNGKAFAELSGAGNPYVVAVGSRQLDNTIRKLARNVGIRLRKKDFLEINHILQAHAEMGTIKRDVWYRVAPIPEGIEVDLGDADHTRVRVTAGQVNIVTIGSQALFYRSAVCLPMAMPAAVGNLDSLKKYINLDHVSVMLLIAWLTYLLAHPKVPASKFVILVLQGNQGSGKTWLCNLILMLLDPNIVGVQILPNNIQDLVVAAQNAHVLVFDNLRRLNQLTADALCVAATGGALSARQLYTDSDQTVMRLHVGLVLNGLHRFVDQADLAQRCLPLELRPLVDTRRKSEAELFREFQDDLPAIQRGLFDLIADIFTHLPTAKVVHPERMIDFSTWLAALELVKGVPEGIYQAEFSQALNQGQLDALLDNSLAAAVLDFTAGEGGGNWSGTPAELLALLSERLPWGTQRARDWPQNAISLSKRLLPLQAGLQTQGVIVEFRRGKERRITITTAACQTGT
jgi:hypothetical protein